MTIGDIIAALAVFILVVTALNAVTIMMTMIAPKKVEEGCRNLIERPKKVFIQGLITFAFVLFLVVTFHSTASGPVKLVSGLLLTFIATIGAFGMGSVVTLLSRRLKDRDGSLSANTALFQASGLCMAAAVAPIVGWLVIAPGLLVVAFGTGIGTLTSRAIVAKRDPGVVLYQESLS